MNPTNPTPAVEALMPCPFCGSEAERFQIDDADHENAGGCGIQCTKCQASTNLTFPCGDDPWPIVTEKWNARALLRQPEAVMPDDLGRIADMLDSYTALMREKVTALEIERWHYLPEVEDYAAKLRAGAAAPSPTPAPSGDEAVAWMNANGAILNAKYIAECRAASPRALADFDIPLVRPAPAAVKLPERQELFSDSGTTDAAFVRGWNACLDAITHANEGKKG